MIKSIMLNWAKTPTEFIGYYINCVCVFIDFCLAIRLHHNYRQSLNEWMSSGFVSKTKRIDREAKAERDRDKCKTPNKQ